jgi:hypothetical protein
MGTDAMTELQNGKACGFGCGFGYQPLPWPFVWLRWAPWPTPCYGGHSEVLAVDVNWPAGSHAATCRQQRRTDIGRCGSGVSTYSMTEAHVCLLRNRDVVAKPGLTSSAVVHGAVLRD